MRNGQNNKRMRNRNNNNNNNNSNNSNRRGQNPMTRVFESNGPDIKIRGTASHVAEKYVQLARDARSSGDPVAAENYYQHAEHYFRLIAAAQEQFRQNNPHLSRPENETPAGARDDAYEDGDDDGQPAMGGSEESAFGTREPQPYIPRDAQPFPQHQQPQPQQQHHQHNQHQPRSYQGNSPADGDVDRLPSFITGGQPPQHQAHQPNQQSPQGQNGHDNQPDRFPLHRRRRRHRGPRNEGQGSEGGDGPAPRE